MTDRVAPILLMVPRLGGAPVWYFCSGLAACMAAIQERCPALAVRGAWVLFAPGGGLPRRADQFPAIAEACRACWAVLLCGRWASVVGPR